MPNDVQWSNVHIYDPDTGYCKRCGSHRETVALEGTLCFVVSNVVAISHRRAAAISEKQKAGNVTATS